MEKNSEWRFLFPEVKVWIDHGAGGSLLRKIETKIATDAILQERREGPLIIRVDG